MKLTSNQNLVHLVLDGTTRIKRCGRIILGCHKVALVEYLAIDKIIGYLFWGPALLYFCKLNILILGLMLIYPERWVYLKY